jgi:hypothetical protein
VLAYGPEFDPQNSITKQKEKNNESEIKTKSIQH